MKQYIGAKCGVEVPKSHTTTSQQTLDQILSRERYDLVPKPEVGDIFGDMTKHKYQSINLIMWQNVCQSRPGRQ